MSLLTPLTIKLLLPDVGSAGRIAGLIFALSTLGCLVGNYFTGFWLMAEFTLNAITSGVGIGLIALAIPVFFYKSKVIAPVPSTEIIVPNRSNSIGDGGWNFKNDIRLAYAIVFIASFCGMSLELAGSRVLAPILGVSLYTWTGIIGVMLAGTCCGNYLGGILADRGVGPALRRFAVLLGLLVGGASAPLIAQSASDNFNPAASEWGGYILRLLGAGLGVLCVLPGLYLSKSRRGSYVITAVFGGVCGSVIAHTACRAFDRAVRGDFFENIQMQPHGSWLIHGLGFLSGAIIASMFVWDAPKKGARVTRSGALSGALLLGGLMSLAILLLSGIFYQYSFMISAGDIVEKVLAWTFGLFFLPMLFLGTISPQVIRLSVPDVKSAGRVAGSIYAWSTAGAIAGTFTTGYFLIGLIGTFRVLMILAFVLTLLAFFVGRLWKNNAMLYAASIIFGGATFGLYAIGYGSNRYDMETKYYAIRVTSKWESGEEVQVLILDHLWHSMVRLDDPTWLYYRHETNLLVIGGGGYTFPRYVDHLMPDVGVDVVEIDPGVTEIAHRKLGLPRETTIRSYHMDGRQFVAERAAKGHYQLVVQDAVNDLSVPYHLMTKEYNDAVKATLVPNGVYLLTLIDSLDQGKLWRAAAHTMRESFAHVYLLSPDGFRDKDGSINHPRHVYIIYGSDRPLDMDGLQAVLDEYHLQDNLQPALAAALLAPQVPWSATAYLSWVKDKYTTVLDDATLARLLAEQKKVVLTDQFCPVDNLMADVFRDR